MVSIKVTYRVRGNTYTSEIISDQPWQQIVHGIESLGGEILYLEIRVNELEWNIK